MRDIPVGNGSLLVTFDEKYQIRDIYYPRVGQENHTDGAPSRFGIWVDGEFSWVAADGWTRSLQYLRETLVTDVVLTNSRLGVSIVCNDTVASHEDIFLRRVTVRNLTSDTRSARVFFHQDFRIYENKIGDCAYYDPETAAIVHYQRDRYFLIGSEPHFDAFATGRKAFGDQEGTWRDAEDGKLAGGVVTEGSVDSVIGIHITLDAHDEKVLYYFIAAGRCHSDVARLNGRVRQRTPESYLANTENYWRTWVNKNDTDFSDLPDEVLDLYKRSLLIVGTQIDKGGAILAANDSDVVLRATDHYSYLWPRDGAFVANALDLAGYPEITQTFFNFCRRIVHPSGYFLQKYNPDGTVASGWHAAWDPHTKAPLVPIQEDETALVLWALWEHFELRRNIDFAHRMYIGLVKPCADFMVGHRDEQTGLPLPSWNLWEDRWGIHTFTCATVVAGLRAAAKFGRLFAENADAETYAAVADQMVNGISEHLYDNQLRRFIRGLNDDRQGGLERDLVIDSSLFATFYFGCFPTDDERVNNTMAAVEQHLSLPGGGTARYQNDHYMRASEEFTGNVWFICTLWLAEYYIAAAKDAGDLAKPLDILKWTAAAALPSGGLGEQMNPLTGEHVSVSPLTWSHSTFIATVHSYLRRQKRLVEQGSDDFPG